MILVDKNKNVIKTVGTKNIPSYWVYSKDIAVNLANPRFIRVAVFITPSQFIIQFIWTLVLSLLFVLIASICIGYQLREIRNRDELLKNRELTVNSIIHDLKAPINSIIALMGVIKLKVTDESTKILARQIIDKAKLLVHDIETILSTANNKPRMILNREEVNIMKLISLAKSDVDILYESKEHTITIDDKTRGNQIVDADKMYLLNAIRNLIENAIKYADKGVMVHISVIRYNNELQVCVSDNGWGISKKDQKMIFNQFYRVPHEHGPRGHGVGLALVKYVIESHGGHITVNSELGKGSKFIFNIPFK
nr:HAMP domain-containing sensor histidine kinase [Prevotella sp.]